ncbi:hypothetical protein [Flavitalea sp.]|nr:hypothetical protein [Flavitalea sp.]
MALKQMNLKWSQVRIITRTKLLHEDKSGNFKEGNRSVTIELLLILSWFADHSIYKYRSY